MEIAVDAGRSSLAQDDDNFKAGMLGFELPDALREGPVRVRFEYGSQGFSRIRLGVVVFSPPLRCPPPPPFSYPLRMEILPALVFFDGQQRVNNFRAFVCFNLSWRTTVSFTDHNSHSMPVYHVSLAIMTD
jgi:hypothetical protein